MHTYLLRNVSLFSALNEEELEALASAFVLQSFRRGQILFHQGSITSSLYIVRSGSVQVTAFGRPNEVKFSEIYGPEQYFGEFSLLDGLPRSGKAVALSNSELLVLTRPAFFRFLEQHSTASMKMLVLISRRLRFALAEVDQPRGRNPLQKIADLLVEVAEQYHHAEGAGPRYELSLRLSADDLAGLAGVTRDEANNAVSELRHADAVTVDRTHILSVDVERLRMYMGAHAA